MMFSATAAFVFTLSISTAPSKPIELSRRGAPPAQARQVAWEELGKGKLIEERDLYDAQLGATSTVRGVSLDRLVERARVATKSDALSVRPDTALLHFVNGMVVPVPLYAQHEPMIDVFVAHERKRDDGTFVSAFAPLIFERSSWVEQRAIVFGDNKVVVSQLDHPLLPATTTRFSPWSHVDSLRAVELVRAKDVHDALDVSPDADVRRGLAVFEQRCQYCHGVGGRRGAGASFGWDFVEPIALSTWRDADSLLYHVKSRKLDGADRGLMMPAQPDVTAEEIRALWLWMEAVAKHGNGAGAGAQRK